MNRRGLMKGMLAAPAAAAAVGAYPEPELKRMARSSMVNITVETDGMKTSIGFMAPREVAEKLRQLSFEYGFRKGGSKPSWYR